MAYCILRTKKLKGFSAVVNSAKHTFREQKTPNANPESTPKNRCMGAKSSTSLAGALRNLLPIRRRKDAVLAIEYLVTASPEYFHDAGSNTTHTRANFFNAALEFLRNKHGKANVISATLHLDETTPHLVAYVVPLNASGKLCAKDFLGGRDKLKRLQTSFFENVGAKFGLERGISGSTATHQKIRHFYSEIKDQPKLKPLGTIDKIAGIMGIKTEAARERENNENALLAHTKAYGRSALLMAKADQGKVQARYEVEQRRSASLATNLDHERLSKTEAEKQLQLAKTQIEIVRQQAVDHYQRNQRLESMTHDTTNSIPQKENHVPKNTKSGLAP